MSRRAAVAFSAAVESSFLVRVARRAGAGSVLLAGLVTARDWCFRTHARILIGLGIPTTPEREARQLETLMALTADSWLVSTLDSWIAAAPVVGRSSWVRQAIRGATELDFSERVRLAGWALVAAALAHALFFLVLGVPVTWIAWTVRIALLAFGVILCWKPGMWASAWRDHCGKQRGDVTDIALT